MNNLGKKWEEEVKKSWEKSFPNSVFLRLPDQQSHYLGTSKNISDFIGFVNSHLYFVECKSTQSNTLNFRNISQLDGMLKEASKPGVRAGILIWFINKDTIIWVPVLEAQKMRKDKCRSINVKMLEDNKYAILNIKSKKKRTYFECDFNCMIDWYKDKGEN